MNVNPQLLSLEKTLGIPVWQDIYEGEAEKYITFTYEDERPDNFADNDETTETATIQVSFNTPEDYDYMEDKKKIKKELKKLGFNVESIQSWMEDQKRGTKRIRRTMFIVNITMEAD